MPPNRQISGRQYELLVQFAETHRGVAMGNLGKGFLGQQEANKAWEGLAVKLNSIGGGVMKTPEKWKRYWHLIKCRTKAKAADIRRKRMATGGGPNTINPLSDLEERIAAVIGKVAIEGITDVQIPVDVSILILTTNNHCMMLIARYKNNKLLSQIYTHYHATVTLLLLLFTKQHGVGMAFTTCVFSLHLLQQHK
ncbi:uncharacterized protein LOC131840644 isoform X2 [Achroia grisella]|nr:uncharacterized protein LOC131840644 isoform X2 [Achroia grisella]